MEALKILAKIFLIIFVCSIAFSQREITIYVKNIFSVFSKLGEFFSRAFGLEKTIGNFLKTMQEPFKSLIIVILVILAIILFFMFLKHFILAIVILVILAIIIYIIFSI